jgi:hypothetical protein
MYEYLETLNNLDPYSDDGCQRLVNYLAGGLNYAIGIKVPDTVAVRSTRSYDAVDIDATSFPMLKVFRMRELIDRSAVADVDLAITYSMMMPDRAQLPGIMHWVARHIIEMLLSQQESSRECPFRILENDASKVTVEYRIMVDNLNQPTYAYLKISCSAQEIAAYSL